MLGGVLILASCSPITYSPRIGFEAVGNGRIVLLTVPCSKEYRLEAISLGTGSGLESEFQTDLKFDSLDVRAEPFDLDISGLVPPDRSRDAAPDWPIHVAVQWNEGTGYSSAQRAPGDGMVTFHPDSSEVEVEVEVTREQFLHEAEASCQTDW